MRIAIDGMKLFIGFLILLNFIYFLWPKDEIKPRPEYMRGNPGVSLLLQTNERSEAPSYDSPVPKVYDPQVKKKPAVEAVNASYSVPEKGTENTDEMAFTGSLNGEETKESGTSSQADSNSMDTNRDNSSNVSDTEPEAVEMEVLAKSIKVDKANTENKAEIENKAQVEAEIEPKSGAQVREDLQCFSLGPFKEKEVAEGVLSDMDALGLQAVVRSTLEKQKTGFWVYLPPYSSRQKAIDEGGKLATLGVADYFIVSDGRSDNAISLGIFKRKQESDKRIKEMNALGYKPRVEVRHEEISLFWIDTQTTKGIDWDGFLNKHFPAGEIESQPRTCG